MPEVPRGPGARRRREAGGVRRLRVGSDMRSGGSDMRSGGSDTRSGFPDGQQVCVRDGFSSLGTSASRVGRGI